MYHDLPVPPASGRSCWQSTKISPRKPARKAVRAVAACTAPIIPGSPEGTPELPEFQSQRLSFCCDRDGCRKRATPPSVRFLGRKVYLAAIVILVSAMRQGPTPRRVRELSERFGADESTIVRWQTFWREHFPQTPFWKVARASFVTLGEIVSLPYSLVDAFLSRHPPCDGWMLLLRFLSPITVPGGLQIKVSQ